MIIYDPRSVRARRARTRRRVRETGDAAARTDRNRRLALRPFTVNGLRVTPENLLLRLARDSSDFAGSFAFNACAQSLLPLPRSMCSRRAPLRKNCRSASTTFVENWKRHRSTDHARHWKHGSETMTATRITPHHVLSARVHRGTTLWLVYSREPRTTATRVSCFDFSPSAAIRALSPKPDECRRRRTKGSAGRDVRQACTVPTTEVHSFAPPPFSENVTGRVPTAGFSPFPRLAMKHARR